MHYKYVQIALLSQKKDLNDGTNNGREGERREEEFLIHPHLAWTHGHACCIRVTASIIRLTYVDFFMEQTITARKYHVLIVCTLVTDSVDTPAFR